MFTWYLKSMLIRNFLTIEFLQQTSADLLNKAFSMQEGVQMPSWECMCGRCVYSVANVCACMHVLSSGAKNRLSMKHNRSLLCYSDCSGTWYMSQWLKSQWCECDLCHVAIGLCTYIKLPESTLFVASESEKYQLVLATQKS